MLSSRSSTESLLLQTNLRSSFGQHRTLGSNTEEKLSKRSGLALLILAKAVQRWGFVLGALAFCGGSIMFMPAINAILLGGILFTVGSLQFVVMDACQLYLDWQRYSHRRQVSDRPIRALTVISFAGSLLFLIGSALFIPTQTNVLGTEAFIVGCVIFTGLALAKSPVLHELLQRRPWQCTRAKDLLLHDSQQNLDSPTPANALSSIARLIDWVNCFNGIGAAFFLVGSILYLPPLAGDPLVDWSSWTLFQVGSAFYSAAAFIELLEFKNQQANNTVLLTL